MLPHLKIRAVLLDLDGLMIDSEPIYRLAWQSAAADLGYDLSDGFYLTLVGLNTRDSEGALIRAFGAEFPLAHFRGLWPERWRQQVEMEGMPIKPGLWDFLGVLEMYRLPMAVATSSDAEQAAISMRAAGLDQRFPCIVTGDQVPNGKPAPDLFLKGAKRLSISPQRCLVLEDSDAGILAAAAAGMPAIMIPDLKSPSAIAAELACRIFPSFNEAAAFVKILLQNQSDPLKLE
jgi:beta-phosphoglucomutase